MVVNTSSMTSMISLGEKTPYELILVEGMQIISYWNKHSQNTGNTRKMYFCAFILGKCHCTDMLIFRPFFQSHLITLFTLSCLNLKNVVSMRLRCFRKTTALLLQLELRFVWCWRCTEWINCLKHVCQIYKEQVVVGFSDTNFQPYPSYYLHVQIVLMEACSAQNIILWLPSSVKSIDSGQNNPWCISIVQGWMGFFLHTRV